MRRTVLFLFVLLLIPAASAFDSQDVTLSSHVSQTVYGTYIYLNGITDGNAKFTFGFGNGDYETTSLNLKDKKSYTSHAQTFTLGSYAVDRIEKYSDGSSIGDAVLTVTQLPKATAAPTTAPTVIPTSVPTQTATSIPTPVPTPAPTLTAVPTTQPTIAPTPSQTSAPHMPLETRPQVGSYATLRIDSDPPGAMIFIDGKSLGVTPKMRDLSPGGYQIDIQLEGYPNFSKKIILQNGDDEPVFVKFKQIAQEPQGSDMANNSSQAVSIPQAATTTNGMAGQTAQNDDKTTPFWFYAVVAVLSLIVIACAIFVFGSFLKGRYPDVGGIMDAVEMPDRTSTAAEIERLLAENPDVLKLPKTEQNRWLAEQIGCHERTVERNREK